MSYSLCFYGAFPKLEMLLRLAAAGEAVVVISQEEVPAPSR